jgi:hypothetical protein
VSKEGEGWYFYHAGHVWGFYSTVVSHRLLGYGYVIMTNGENGNELLSEVAGLIEEAYAFDLDAKTNPRSYGPIRKSETRIDSTKQ